MQKRLGILLIVALSKGVHAQDTLYVGEARRDFASVRDLIIRSATKMPDDKYGFRPVPAVRTFGQIIAHIADDQYNLCAPVRGENRRDAYTQIEQSVTTKTALVDTLRKAFAYCDSTYEPLTDASARTIVANRSRSKMSMMQWNVWHTWEHYGNLVTYLRINGIVPPSSEPRPAASR
jgi:uncharacterized damage-inducible protein DinB